MSDINKVMLYGRLGADPVLRETQNGHKMMTFNMATDQYVKSKDESTTHWHRVVVWGNTAERYFPKLKKGVSVLIEGKMKSGKYESKEGETKYTYEVHADVLRFLHQPSYLKSAFEEQGAEEQLLA